MAPDGIHEAFVVIQSNLTIATKWLYGSCVAVIIIIVFAIFRFDRLRLVNILLFFYC